MKVALIISGYLRTFRDNLALLKNQIIDSFDEVDIYIHFTLNEDKEDKYLNKSKLEDILFVEKELQPKACLIESNDLLSEDNNLNILQNTWLKYYKLNALKKINENVTGKKYDLVIKTRPDLVLTKKINISYDKLVIPSESLMDKKRLQSSDEPYICDIFAYGPSNLMDKYFDFYLELDMLTKKFMPISESLLYRHLNESEIPYVKENIEYSVLLSKCNVIAISGDSSSGKSTLAELLKNCFFNNSFVLEGDRYHKWERDSDKWAHFTHLDPEANYLSKLEEDIFNLKIGRSIFQVDYDHKLGKFTNPEIINPNENLIVCGLHPLLSKQSNIYDLKIYIEADHKLKTHWKLTRDVTERGKNYNQVLEQINSRKEDYKKYIKPQKENADMVISFLTGAELEKSESLKLAIAKKFKIEQFKADLIFYGIDFSLSEDDKYNEIYFEKYTLSNIFQNKLNKLSGSYYEYILLAIKNIYD